MDIKQLEKSQVELTLQLSSERIESEYSKKLSEYSKKFNFPGSDSEKLLLHLLSQNSAGKYGKK